MRRPPEPQAPSVKGEVPSRCNRREQRGWHRFLLKGRVVAVLLILPVVGAIVGSLLTLEHKAEVAAAFRRSADRLQGGSMVTIEDVRSLARTLPRSTEALVRDRVKFRVGQIVYLAFSRDELVMGFAFPKEEREALVSSEPEKFMMPDASDLRFNWVLVLLAAIDEAEMREIVIDAWRIVVPKRVAAEYDAGSFGISRHDT